jgi:hypothetical protein
MSASGIQTASELQNDVNERERITVNGRYFGVSLPTDHSLEGGEDLAGGGAAVEAMELMIS